MYISMCATCAEKVNKSYYVTDMPGSDHIGACKLCFQVLHICQYEVHPRRTRYQKARSGGGERAKATRR